MGGFISVRFQSDIASVYFRPIPVRQDRGGDDLAIAKVLFPPGVRPASHTVPELLGPVIVPHGERRKIDYA